MATIDQIRKALAPIRKLVDQETVYEIEGVSFTLARIAPNLEPEVLKEMNTQSDTPAEILASTDRYRNALLSHAIIQIGDVDLRHPEIDTGDRTPEGKVIYQAKTEVVRQILEPLDRNIGLALMARYGDMMERQEIRVRKATTWNPQDLDIEIQYLETRIEELKQRKEAVFQTERERNPVLTQAQQGVAYYRQPEPPKVNLDVDEPMESSFQDAPVPHVAARAVGLRENP